MDTMTGHLLCSNTRLYFVTKNEDGTINLYLGENRIDNAGTTICGFGGLQATIDRLGREVTMEEYLTILEENAAKAKEAREKGRLRAAEEERKRAAERKAKYDALLAGSKDGVIETTAENVGIVLRYLNTTNWGGWNLPKMTISYSANQYDCDGKTAATMILDTPIVIDEETGEKAMRFKVDCPMGHLKNYRRI